MVAVETEGDAVVVRVLGTHVAWALRRSFCFPRTAIVSAGPAGRDLRPPWLRCPGTCLPFVICAGTYYGGGRKEFWDRTQWGRGIRIDLAPGSPFTRVVVDVADPASTLRSLGAG